MYVHHITKCRVKPLNRHAEKAHTIDNLRFDFVHSYHGHVVCWWCLVYAKSQSQVRRECEENKKLHTQSVYLKTDCSSHDEASSDNQSFSHLLGRSQVQHLIDQ